MLSAAPSASSTCAPGQGGVSGSAWTSPNLWTWPYNFWSCALFVGGGGGEEESELVDVAESEFSWLAPDTRASAKSESSSSQASASFSPCSAPCRRARFCYFIQLFSLLFYTSSWWRKARTLAFGGGGFLLSPLFELRPAFSPNSKMAFSSFPMVQASSSSRE